MDIRNVGNHGNVDRSGESSKRAGRPQTERTVVIPTVKSDDARISATGREAAARVDRLAERARQDGGDREALVEAAKQKLLSGELDTDAAFAETAQRLFDRGFLSV